MRVPPPRNPLGQRFFFCSHPLSSPHPSRKNLHVIISLSAPDALGAAMCRARMSTIERSHKAPSASPGGDGAVGVHQAGEGHANCHGAEQMSPEDLARAQKMSTACFMAEFKGC